MKNQQEGQQIMEVLRDAYQDPNIRENPELAELIVAAATRLENAEAPQLIMQRLDRQIGDYLLHHQFHAPKTLLDVQRRLKEEINWLQAGLTRTTNLW